MRGRLRRPAWEAARRLELPAELRLTLSLEASAAACEGTTTDNFFPPPPSSELKRDLRLARLDLGNSGTMSSSSSSEIIMPGASREIGCASSIWLARKVWLWLSTGQEVSASSFDGWRSSPIKFCISGMPSTVVNSIVVNSIVWGAATFAGGSPLSDLGKEASSPLLLPGDWKPSSLSSSEKAPASSCERSSKGKCAGLSGGGPGGREGRDRPNSAPRTLRAARRKDTSRACSSLRRCRNSSKQKSPFVTSSSSSSSAAASNCSMMLSERRCFSWEDMLLFRPSFQLKRTLFPDAAAGMSLAPPKDIRLAKDRRLAAPVDLRLAPPWDLRLEAAIDWMLAPPKEVLFCGPLMLCRPAPMLPSSERTSEEVGEAARSMIYVRQSKHFARKTTEQ